MSNKSSFEKIQEWVQSIIDNTEKQSKMVLIGNKIDLQREVSTEEGKKLAEFYKIPYFEASAKENIGISEFMKQIIGDVIETFKPKDSINLESQNT